MSVEKQEAIFYFKMDDEEHILILGTGCYIVPCIWQYSARNRI